MNPIQRALVQAEAQRKAEKELERMTADHQKAISSVGKGIESKPVETVGPSKTQAFKESVESIGESSPRTWQRVVDRHSSGS